MMKASLLAAAAAVVLAPAGMALAAPIGPVSQIHVTASPALTHDARTLDARDVSLLTQNLKSSLEGRLKGANRLSDQGGVLDVQLVRAKPSRPTMTELSHRPDLSLSSVYRGGMAVTGTYTAPDGAVTPINYQWDSFDIRDSRTSSTWGDAERGFQLFANSLAHG